MLFSHLAPFRDGPREMQRGRDHEEGEHYGFSRGRSASSLFFCLLGKR